MEEDAQGLYQIKHPFEAAVTTDLRAAPHNFTLWDTETQSQLVIFKGEKTPVQANCLQFIDSTHMITAHDNVLRIWSVVNKFRQEQKLILPARPSAIAVSPCSQYLIVGKQETLNIWQMSTGNLVTSAQRHYQTISVIKVCTDSSFIVTGGEDGLVFVWSMADLICGTRNISRLNQDQQEVKSENEPRYAWQHHSGQVTALHLTSEGKNGRCITASLDETINIYSMASGERLTNIMMPCAIWSVVMNRRETCAYLGGQNGDIYEIATNALGLSLIINMRANADSDGPHKPIYLGHKGKVTCLELSIDGRRLLSASLDTTCKIWNTETKRLIRDIKHQGPVVNLKLLLIPDSLAISTQTKNEALAIKPLKRALHLRLADTSIAIEDLFNEENVVNVRNDNDIRGIISAIEEDDRVNITASTINISEVHNNGGSGIPNENETEKPEDMSTISSLKKTIKDLYLLAAEKIFKDASHEALRPYTSPSVSESPESRSSGPTKRRRLS